MISGCKRDATQTEDDLPVTKVARYSYAPVPRPPSSFEVAVRSSVPLEPKQQTGVLNLPVNRALTLNLRYSRPNLGITDATRIGNQIDPLSFDATIAVHGNVNAQTLVNECRVVVLQYLEDESATLLDVNDLLATSHPYSPYQYAEQEKYKVLFDRPFCLVNDPASSLFCQTVPMSLDLSQCLPVYYDGNVSKRNQLFLLVYCNGQEDDINSPLITGGWSFLYADA